MSAALVEKAAQKYEAIARYSKVPKQRRVARAMVLVVRSGQECSLHAYHTESRHWDAAIAQLVAALGVRADS